MQGNIDLFFDIKVGSSDPSAVSAWGQMPDQPLPQKGEPKTDVRDLPSTGVPECIRGE